MKTKNEVKVLKVLEQLGGKFYCTHAGSLDGRRQTQVWLDIKGVIYTGTSECSHKDRFDKKFGRAIALGRAMKNYNNNIICFNVPDFLKEHNRETIK